MVLTVPDRQDSGMVDNNRFLTRKKGVRFRGWTEIAECDASTASGLVECEPREDKNCLYRPSVGETAGARYKSGWDGILVKRIACCARMVVNFAGEFLLTEGGPLRLLK